jgi:7,8-dihydropterin-6-yl-methyl-4-(beta-D-ribofuranosyl)aminobenzene 5'-phosphate synthase
MTRLNCLRLTILVDNVAECAGLNAEHGFSCLVEADGVRILFDTGAKDALLTNSCILGKSLFGLNALVFSHGHYDHTGGLAAIFGQLGTTRVVAHPKVLGAHRSQRTGYDRDIGIPESSRDSLRHLPTEFSVEPVEIMPGIWSTGEIPRSTIDNEVSELFVDSDGTQRDCVPDDMALILRHQAGLVVLLGCAHAGVADTLTRVEQLFPGEPLLGLLGGMHLERSPSERICQLAERLSTSRLRFISPGHCTGERAKRALREKLHSCYLPMRVGLEIEIDRVGAVFHAQLPARNNQHSLDDVCG